MTINVTVENKGTVTETFSVKLGESNAYPNGSSDNDNPVREITETSMVLEAGAVQIVDFTWDTTGVTVGFHFVIATAIVTDDMNTDNNSLTIFPPLKIDPAAAD